MKRGALPSVWTFLVAHHTYVGTGSPSKTFIFSPQIWVLRYGSNISQKHSSYPPPIGPLHLYCASWKRSKSLWYMGKVCPSLCKWICWESFIMPRICSLMFRWEASYLNIWEESESGVTCSLLHISVYCLVQWKTLTQNVASIFFHQSALFSSKCVTHCFNLPKI